MGSSVSYHAPAREAVQLHGRASEDEANAWAAALRDDSEAHVLFGSSNYYAYIARRPQRPIARAAG